MEQESMRRKPYLPATITYPTRAIHRETSSKELPQPNQAFLQARIFPLLQAAGANDRPRGTSFNKSEELVESKLMIL